MKKAISLVLLLITVFLLCSCGSNSAKIGTIEGKGVSVEEYNYFLYTVKDELLYEAGIMEEGAASFWQTEVEGKKAIELAKEKAFEEIMSFEAKYLKALENGFKIDNSCKKNAEEQYNDVATSQGGEDKLKEFLNEIGSSEKAYKRILQKGYCITRFIAEYKTTSDEFEVTDDEIHQRIYEYYGEMGPITSIMGKQIIFVTVDEDFNPLDEEEIAKKKEQADRIYKRIINGEDFDTLMNKYSEDPDLPENIDGYMIREAEASDEMKQKAFTLEDGQISEPVLSDYGYHIIKVLSKNYSTMDSVSENVKDELEAEKESLVAEKWKKEYTVTRNDEEFVKIQ